MILMKSTRSTLVLNTTPCWKPSKRPPEKSRQKLLPGLKAMLKPGPLLLLLTLGNTQTDHLLYNVTVLRLLFYPAISLYPFHNKLKLKLKHNSTFVLKNVLNGRFDSRSFGQEISI